MSIAERRENRAARRSASQCEAFPLGAYTKQCAWLEKVCRAWGGVAAVAQDLAAKVCDGGTVPIAAVRCRRQALRPNPIFKDRPATLPQKSVEEAIRIIVGLRNTQLSLKFLIHLSNK